MIKQAKMKHHAHKIFFLLNHFVTQHKQHGDCYYVVDSFVAVKLGSKENALMNCVYFIVELVDIKNLEFEDFVVDDDACNHCFWFPCVATLRPSWLGQGCTPMDGNNIIRKDRLVFMLTSDAYTFWQKRMRKRKKLILLGGVRWRCPPWIRQ